LWSARVPTVSDDRREVTHMSKIVFTDTKRTELFRMSGKELRTLAAGNARLAVTKAAKAEIARRKANLTTKKSGK
jgi:hypothetical protein